MNELMKDLSKLPSIIGNTGLSIAHAQKEFNLAYLEDLERVVDILSAYIGQDRPEELRKILQEVAPTRYQFTETELEFRADLSQTLAMEGTANVSVGVGAVAVNASLTLGFGYDYQASARIRTTLHAVPAARDVMTQLLDRTAQLTTPAAPGDAPKATETDKQIKASLERLNERLKPGP